MKKIFILVSLCFVSVAFSQIPSNLSLRIQDLQFQIQALNSQKEALDKRIQSCQGELTADGGRWCTSGRTKTIDADYKKNIESSNAIGKKVAELNSELLALSKSSEYRADEIKVRSFTDTADKLMRNYKDVERDLTTQGLQIKEIYNSIDKTLLAKYVKYVSEEAVKKNSCEAIKSCGDIKQIQSLQQKQTKDFSAYKKELEAKMATLQSPPTPAASPAGNTAN